MMKGQARSSAGIMGTRQPHDLGNRACFAPSRANRTPNQQLGNTPLCRGPALRGDEDIAVAVIRSLSQHFDRRSVISSAGRRRVTSSYGPWRRRAAGRGGRGDGHTDHDGGGAMTIMTHALSLQVAIHQRILTPAEPGSRGGQRRQAATDHNVRTCPRAPVAARCSPTRFGLRGSSGGT